MPAMPPRAVPSLLLLAAAVATAPVPARAGDGTPADADAPPLIYLGLNGQGAEEWLRAKDGAVVVRVPGGSYLRRPYEGGPAGEDPVPVDVRSFLMDKHEVTNGQFARFLAETGGDGRGLVDPTAPGLVRDGGAWRAAPGADRLPVTAATGHGALAYARWCGARLPDADRWMKAAGGAEGRLYPWGDAPPDGTLANFGLPERTGLHPVGSHPAGASPFGCLDMAGNAYERVMTRVRGADGAPAEAPVMLKGASWLSPHPLNLRVLDLCMQPAGTGDGSVGFRCCMDDPEPDRPARTAAAPAVLRLATDFDAAVAEARERGVPMFLSLLHDTCGQCDRTIAQCYRDPRFVRYCNENLVVVFGHQPGDAGDDPHPARADGSCTLHAGLRCVEHLRLYGRGLEVVTTYTVSPGNFVLDPRKVAKGAGARCVLVPEADLPKWGNAVDAYLAAFERARKAMAAE